MERKGEKRKGKTEGGQRGGQQEARKETEEGGARHNEKRKGGNRETGGRSQRERGKGGGKRRKKLKLTQQMYIHGSAYIFKWQTSRLKN